MRPKSYDTLESSSTSKELIIPTMPNGPIILNKTLEIVFHPPKGVVHKSTHNPNVRAT